MRIVLRGETRHVPVPKPPPELAQTIARPIAQPDRATPRHVRLGLEQGRVIGFSGRVLKGDEKTAKYVNSPETPIFTKSRVLYGLDKAKRAQTMDDLRMSLEKFL